MIKRNNVAEESPISRLKRALDVQNYLSDEAEQMLTHDILKTLTSYFDLEQESLAVGLVLNDDRTKNLCIRCNVRQVKNIKML